MATNDYRDIEIDDNMGYIPRLAGGGTNCGLTSSSSSAGDGRSSALSSSLLRRRLF
jgi:hypothetical protein